MVVPSYDVIEPLSKVLVEVGRAVWCQVKNQNVESVFVQEMVDQI